MTIGIYHKKRGGRILVGGPLSLDKLEQVKFSAHVDSLKAVRSASDLGLGLFAPSPSSFGN